MAMGSPGVAALRKPRSLAQRAHCTGYFVEFQRRQLLHVGGETLRYLRLRTELLDGERTAQGGTRIVMAFTIVDLP